MLFQHRLLTIHLHGREMEPVPQVLSPCGFGHGQTCWVTLAKLSLLRAFCATTAGPCCFVSRRVFSAVDVDAELKAVCSSAVSVIAASVVALTKNFLKLFSCACMRARISKATERSATENHCLPWGRWIHRSRIIRNSFEVRCVDYCESYSQQDHTANEDLMT
jgi:hypothetical protein